jgi:hypothetical protein
LTSPNPTGGGDVSFATPPNGKRGEGDGVKKPWCRYPKECDLTEEQHSYCWGAGIESHQCFGGLTEQHRPKKGMGGNNPASKVVSILCAGLHDQIDNNVDRPYSDLVVTYPSGERDYCIYENGHVVVRHSINGASADRSDDPPDVARQSTAEALTEYGPGESIREIAVTKDAVSVAGRAAKSTPGPLSPLDPIPPDLDYDEWVAWGEMLGRAHNVTAWRIAEWLAYGEERSWGQMYTEGMHATGKSYSTLSTYVSTVKAFEGLPTPATLSMSVLTALASVARSEPEKAQSLLLQAEAEGWTSDEARGAVKALRGEPIIEHEYCVCLCGHRHRKG